MPTVHRDQGFRFFFYSLEDGEPPHIHVSNGSKKAKYWLNPIELASSDGFRAHELGVVRALVMKYQADFQRRWHEYFDT